jgi:uncharacterized caspase-like protein
VVGSLPPRHILVLLDSCRSGIALGRLVEGSQSNAGNPRARVSRRVITAADFQEDASDSGPVPGHSLFTGTLLQGLRSGEVFADQSRDVTAAELAQFLRRRVRLASGDRQTPDFGRFNNDDFGEMIFPRLASPATTEPPVPPPPPRTALYQTDAPELTRGVAGKRPSRLAIVIGADEYQDHRLPQLRSSVATARGVAEALRALSYEVHVGTNLPRMQLEEMLARAAHSASSDLASVVVFYSGHAVAGERDSYLALKDTRMEQAASTSLSFSRLQAILADAGAQQKIFLFDVASTNPFRSRSPVASAIRPNVAGWAAWHPQAQARATRLDELRLERGFRLLYSTSPDQISLELTAGSPFSLFGWSLIRGLRGEAAEPDGLITFESLQRFVSSALATQSRQLGREVVPVSVGNSLGSFPIGVAPPRR